MTMLSALSMDGQSYELAVEMIDDVPSVKAKLSAASGIHCSEIMLLADANVLDNNEALRAILSQDEPEVIFARIENSGTKGLLWYDRWVEAVNATNEDTKSVDAFAWIRLGASLYSLGEYPLSWAAYKQSALIARGVAVAAVQDSRKVWIRDEELLMDPVVGKYMRCVNRAWGDRRRFVLDEASPMQLLRVLVQSSRAQEIFERKWDVSLPNYFGVVRRWILEHLCRGECRLPPGATPGRFTSASCNQLTMSLLYRGSIKKGPTEACLTLAISSLDDGEELYVRGAFRTAHRLEKTAKKKETCPKKPTLGANDDEDWYEEWDEDWEEDWGEYVSGTSDWCGEERHQSDKATFEANALAEAAVVGDAQATTDKATTDKA